MGNPGGIERERSLVIEKVLSMLHAEGVTLPVMSRKLNIPLDELTSLLFGVGSISGGGGLIFHTTAITPPYLK